MGHIRALTKKSGSVRATGCGFLRGAVCLGRDLVPHVPEIFVEQVFHPLMKNFDWSTHRAYYAAADDSLCQFEMMKTEQVDALVKIEQAFGDIVQSKELFMPAVEIIDAESGLQQLSVKGIAQTGPNVEERQKARGIQTAAMPKSRANQMIVVWRDRLQNMQHGDRIIEHLIGAANQSRGV